MSIVDKVRSLASKKSGIKKVVKLFSRPILRILEARSIEDYNKWLLQNIPTVSELGSQKELSKSFKYRPLISIIVPVYNPPKRFFIEMIESVLAQSYENWELILIDDASPDKWVKSEIIAFSKKDTRISHLFLSENLHIAGATNKGIDSAQGEYIALLDNDDILQPNALFEVITALNENRKLQFIYSDEDKIEGDTSRHLSPYFKPSWNPDFLYSVNYITHLAVIEKKLIKEVGGPNGEYNGAQDWELFLRIARSIDVDNIYHIPKILYSWRVHEASTASGIEAKPYVVEAQRKAIKADLDARGYYGYSISQDPLYSAQWTVGFASPKKRTVHVFVETTEQFRSLKQLINKDDNKKNYSVSMYEGGVNSRVINNLASDYFLYLPESSKISTLETLELLMKDAQRPDIAFVFSRYTNDEIMENIEALINPSALSYIRKTSTRDITKHFYSTVRYNVPFNFNKKAYCIEVKKLQRVLQVIDLEQLSSSPSLIEKYGYRNLYNPYVSLL